MNHLLSQVSANTKDLDDLQDKLDKGMIKHVDVREEVIKQKDKQIAGELTIS